MFYHFATKDRLLAQAFTYAAERDLARLDAVVRANTDQLTKLRRILRLYAPAGRSKAWAMWIDGWSEALRSPELERVSRRLDLRWKEALTDAIEVGVKEGAFTCADPEGAAWRITALLDGLALQVTVHGRVITRRQLDEWVQLATARELAL